MFSLPREKQIVWLTANKQYVIDRLNADFQKPWVRFLIYVTTQVATPLTQHGRELIVWSQVRWIDM